jgi:hypothetical protein
MGAMIVGDSKKRRATIRGPFEKLVAAIAQVPRDEVAAAIEAEKRTKIAKKNGKPLPS